MWQWYFLYKLCMQIVIFQYTYFFSIIQIRFKAYFYFEVFHTRCINEWLRRKNTCPICRERIGGGDGEDSSNDNINDELVNDEQQFVGTTLRESLSLPRKKVFHLTAIVLIISILYHYMQVWAFVVLCSEKIYVTEDVCLCNQLFQRDLMGSEFLVTEGGFDIIRD